MWKPRLRRDDAVCVPRLWQSVIGSFGASSCRPPHKPWSAATTDFTQSHEKLQSGLIWVFYFTARLFTVQSPGEVSFFPFLERAVIHCNFDTSSVCSAVFPPLLNDVGDTRCFCVALLRFYSQAALMHTHQRFESLSHLLFFFPQQLFVLHVGRSKKKTKKKLFFIQSSFMSF